MMNNTYRGIPFYSIEGIAKLMKDIFEEEEKKRKENPEKYDKEQQYYKNLIDEILNKKSEKTSIDKMVNKKPCSCKECAEDKKIPENFKMENMEDRKGVILTFIIPGLNKSDVQIKIQDNFVRVSSDKEAAFFGKIDQNIKMKFDIDLNNSKAKFENGILTIYVYKKPINEYTLTIE